MTTEALNPSIDEAALRFMSERRPQVWQTPEGTQEADPYTETDVANIELINSQIADSESNILEEREAAEQEFTLDTPRLAALGKLNIKPLAPDVDFGVLAATDGTPYALIYNHNMACVREPLKQEGLLEQTVIFDGPANGTILDPGVSEIQITPVNPDMRLESMSVERFLDSYTVAVNGVEMNLPVLVVKGFDIGGVAYDCPTIVEKIGGSAGEILNRVGDGLSNLELGKTLESAGKFMGSAIGNFAQGTYKGIKEAINN